MKDGVTKEVELMPSLATASESKIDISTDWGDDLELPSGSTRIMFTVTTPNGTASHESPYEG